MKILSLNINWSNFLDRIEGLLEREKPDVVCLQECMEKDLPRLERASGGRAIFAPRFELPDTREGVVLMSRFPMSDVRIQYYTGEHDPSHRFEKIPMSQEENDLLVGRMLVSADVHADDGVFRVATTHFSWTHDGEPSDKQRRDMQALLAFLESRGEFVLAGDLNGRRGGEIFSMLSERYRDNIPVQYQTSIDASLHRSGATGAEWLSRTMVDGLFTTPAYVASDVRLEGNVSDHYAVVATISKATL